MNITEIENQVQLITNENDLSCKFCNKVYKTKKTLTKHEENHEKKEEKLTCKICDKKFQRIKFLEKHKADHPDYYPFSCETCFKRFSNEEEKDHHSDAHNKAKLKRIKCKICTEKYFSNEVDYLYHIKDEHKGKLNDYFMCSECGKQFKTRGELVHHTNSKCGTIKQYKCKVCGVELMSAGSLHNHMLIHNGERSHMCRFCAKQFLTAGQLKVHERSHTQEKAFICNVCGKGFCHRQSLITHSTIHTGIKPYLCENCLNSFSCVGNLLKHRRTHAETCGMIPLTTHRVVHPATKMKVRVNTPENSKLRIPKKEKEIQEKLKALEEKEKSSSNTNDIDIPSNEDIVPQIKTEEAIKRELKNDIEIPAEIYVQMTSKNLSNEGSKETDIPTGNTNDSSITKSTFCDDIPKINLTNTNIQLLDDKSVNYDAPYFISYNELLFDHTVVEYGSEVVNNRTITENNGISGSKQEIICNTDATKAAAENNSLKEEREDDTFDNVDIDHNESDSDISSDEKLEASTANGNNSKMVEDGEQELKSKDEHSKENIDSNKRPKRKCGNIEITLKELEKFIEERGLKDDKSKMVCKYCNKSYNLPKCLLKHEREHEDIKSKLDVDELEEKDVFLCSCCKMPFTSKEECRNHQNTAHADMLTCKECLKIFAHPDSLRTHKKIFHNGQPRKVYSYVCDKCGVQFKQKACLRHHTENNCGPGPFFECKVCGKSFSSLHVRKTHMVVHESEKKLSCKFCSKTFHWKGQLKIHERSHTGEKPFKCLYCPKAFAYRESLITHSSMHTGIKPHLCKACGLRFSCIGNLIKHRNTHASTCGVWYSKNQE